ncbi:MAG TPA: hypothetical protein VH877_13840 [Polyangia bacterium]|nr:hypothetical protein [Polyangia bacterium]
MELFRQCPELVAYLLREVLGVPLPAYTEVRVEESNFTQPLPTESRADLVLTLNHGAPLLGVVVEMQRQIDDDKPFSWPFYLAGLRHRIRGPVILLVICDDEAVARWAREPIELGPGWVLRVYVLGPAQIPWIKDRDQARRLPELAVLSAAAHGNEPSGLEVVMATLEGLLTLDAERRSYYYDLVLASLNQAARQALEQELTMQGGKYEYKSDFARTYFAEGEAKGRAEGEAKGRAEGEAKGRAEGEVRALLALLTARGIAVDPSTRDRILGCTDLEQLERWIVRAATAMSVHEVLDAS